MGKKRASASQQIRGHCQRKYRRNAADAEGLDSRYAVTAQTAAGVMPTAVCVSKGCFSLF